VWKDGGLVEVVSSFRPRPRLQIISDRTTAVLSPVDGSIISSRADMREHNRRNDCEDVGNDPGFQEAWTPRPLGMKPVQESVHEAIEQIEAGNGAHLAPATAEDYARAKLTSA